MRLCVQLTDTMGSRVLTEGECREWQQVERIAKPLPLGRRRFAVNEFLQGARGAYEMILMGFEAGRLDELRPFLSNEVYESFAHVIEERKRQGLQIEAHFVGLRELVLQDANFDSATDVGEVTVRFVGELTYVVRDATGAIVEGDEKTVKRQADVWTFARQMGANDPNWQLVGTGE